MPRRRVITPVLPSEIGTVDGLAHTLWLPPSTATPVGGVVILHGAGSCKESHHDFARAALPLGIAALAFDARGHGESSGELDGRAAVDERTAADRLREAL